MISASFLATRVIAPALGELLFSGLQIFHRFADNGEDELVADFAVVIDEGTRWIAPSMVRRARAFSESRALTAVMMSARSCLLQF